MIAAIWHFLVAGVVIYGISKLMKGVRCDSYLDAVMVAFFYAIISFVLHFVVALLGFGPAVFVSLAVPFLGVAAVFVVALIVGFLVSAVSLYVADQIVEGFEIKDFGTTMLACFVIGLANMLLAKLGLF